MSFWSLFAAFAPWVSFKLIMLVPILDPISMMKSGIVIAALICAYQGYIGLHKGALLWAGLLFFSVSLIAVPIMNNVWFMKHLGVLSHGTLASFTWVSIMLNKPLTAEYAKKLLIRNIGRRRFYNQLYQRWIKDKLVRG